MIRIFDIVVFTVAWQSTDRTLPLGFAVAVFTIGRQFFEKNFLPNPL